MAGPSGLRGTRRVLGSPRVPKAHDLTPPSPRVPLSSCRGIIQGPCLCWGWKGLPRIPLGWWPSPSRYRAGGPTADPAPAEGPLCRRDGASTGKKVALVRQARRHHGAQGAPGMSKLLALAPWCLQRGWVSLERGPDSHKEEGTVARPCRSLCCPPWAWGGFGSGSIRSPGRGRSWGRGVGGRLWAAPHPRAGHSAVCGDAAPHLLTVPVAVPVPQHLHPLVGSPGLLATLLENERGVSR